MPHIGPIVGEPFGNFGTMMPAGHDGIYLDHLCAASPTELRPGELGVVLFRYHDLHQMNLDWMAVPASVFFYGVDNPADAPAFMTLPLEAELPRTVPRRAPLRLDRLDRHRRQHSPRATI